MSPLDGSPADVPYQPMWASPNGQRAIARVSLSCAVAAAAITAGYEIAFQVLRVTQGRVPSEIQDAPLLLSSFALAALAVALAALDRLATTAQPLRLGHGASLLERRGVWSLALSLSAVALSSLLTAIFYTAPRAEGLILMVSKYFPVSEAVFCLAAIAGMFALIVHKQLDRAGLAFRESAARWGQIIGYSILILYAAAVVMETVIGLLMLLYMLVIQPLFHWPSLTM